MLRRLILGAVGVALFAACDSSSLDSPKSGDVGKPCKRSADCASGQCVPRIDETITDTTDGVCSQTCVGNGDCVAGWSCLSMAGVDVCQCRRSADVCDGLDNDCNGVVDDGPCACKHTVCGEACIDTSSDPLNCGGCGVRCEGTSSCVGGTCACPSGLVACGPVCVNLQTDALNCGACGKGCGIGTCAGGACGCTAPPHEPCALPDPNRLCGDDGRCHTVGHGFLKPDRPELTAGATYLFAAYTPDIITIVRLNGTPGSKELKVGTRGSRPRVATDHEDFAYYLAKAPGSMLMEPSELVGCPAGTCGSPIATNVEAPGLKLFGGNVYWVEGGNLRRCALTGCPGGVEDLAPTPPGTAGKILADATGVYGIFGASVYRWTQASGVFSKLFDITAPNLLAADDTTLYVTTDTGIMSCPKAACTSATIFAKTSVAPNGIGVRGAAVHWTSANSLFHCPKTSGCVPQRITESSPLEADDENTIFTVENATAGYVIVRRLSK